MSSSASSASSSLPPVLSREFFSTYDDLQNAASFLASSQLSYDQTKAKLDKAREDRSTLANEFRRNQQAIIEETNRIELVSNHWFYGTTALQPQLWFRGGCPGKKERAKARLQASHELHPKLAAALDNIDSNILPPLKEKEQETRAKLLMAKNANAECKAMREHATSQYPSVKLQRLQEETRRIQDELAQSKKQDEELMTVVSKFSVAQSKYQDAVWSMERAKSRKKKQLELKERLEWKSRKDETFRKWDERDMEREAEEALQCILRAGKYAHEGDMAIRQAIVSIPMSVRGHAVGVSLSLAGPSRMNFVSGSNCGCSSLQVQAINDQIEVLEQDKSRIEHQVATAEQLAANSQKETTAIKERLQQNRTLVDREQDCIVSDLRSRVNEGQPSAPPEHFDAAATPFEGTQAPLHDEPGIPMATAVPLDDERPASTSDF